MYPYVLGVHNIVRWLVLLAGVAAVFLARRGWLGRRQWTDVEARATRAFTGLLDLQFLIGLLLYAVFSPLPRQTFRDMIAAMRGAPTCYFLVGNPVMLLSAMVGAHVGA